MDLNNVIDIAPFILAVATVIGAFVGYRKLMSEGVFVKPSVILDLQKRANESERRADDMAVKYRALWAELESVKYNNKQNDRRMKEIEDLHEKERAEWKEEHTRLLAGIEKLINQIVKRHDSRPDWTPYGDKGK